MTAAIAYAAASVALAVYAWRAHGDRAFLAGVLCGLAAWCALLLFRIT